MDRAIAIHHRFLRGEGEQDPAKLLAAHPDLQEILGSLLADDAEDQEDQDDQVAEARLGDFRIVAELGRGGMGVVYEAEQVTLGRRVALKVLPSASLLDRKALARFRREAQLAASLDHPGITKVFAVGHEGDQHFFAMELVPGQSLATVIRDRRTTAPAQAIPPGPRDHLVDFALDSGITLAEALQHAHSAGVIHRDVKPGNVLVRADGSVVLTDFGIARGDQAISVTLTGEFAGTPGYASPEQLRGHGSTLDHRADVFSLGATLYELLTLRHPFEAATVGETRVLIERVDPAPPSRWNRRVPRDLDAIVLRALEKDPKARYQTAAALADDLRRCRDHKPVQARPVGLGTKLSRWSRRNPIAASLLATIAGSLLAVTWLQQESAASERRFRSVKVAQDVRLLTRAIQQAPGPLPQHVPELTRVVATADELLGRVPGLQSLLVALQSTGVPSDTVQPDRLLTEHPATPRLQWLRRARAAIAHRLQQLVAEGRASEDWQDQVDEKLATMDREADLLERTIAKRRRYRFDDPDTEYLHDTIEDQIEELTWLEHHGVAELRRRLAAAKVAGELSEPSRAAWQRASQDAAADPRYAGLQLLPQPGLEPIGKDPTSGLLEFAHPRSGTIPQRDANGELVIDATSALVFVLLPGATARIGSSLTQGEMRYAPARNEAPVREVRLAAYLLSKYEMTHVQWVRLAEGLDVRYECSQFEGREGFETKPICRVRWNDCDTLCRANGLALPTEAQWEYACRAGTETPWWCGSDTKDLMTSESVASPAPDRIDVFASTPNPFGLLCMHGNVQEWCADEYVKEGGDVRAGDGLRTGAVDGDARAIRGGCYTAPASSARSAKRDTGNPALDKEILGLRPAMTLRIEP